jgi:hypothetical protein
MRELLRDLVEHLGLTVEVDQWSGIARAKAKGLNGRMEIYTDFSEYFEVSYYSNAGMYLGGFMNSDEQDEMWEFNDILSEFEAFCGE